MSDIGPPPTGRSNRIVERAKAILLTPKTEWPVIDAEPATIGDIFKSYVLPLAAIGPVAGFIGSMVFGYTIFGVTYRPTIGAALGSAIIGYVVSLIGVYLLALIIENLAPQFSATKDRTQAFKVAAYASTAAWVVGIFALLPQLAVLAIIGGIYSIYLLYLGLPIVMKAPADKAISYVAVVIVVAIVLRIVLGLLTVPLVSAFTPIPAIGTTAMGTGAIGGTLAVPGAGSVDLDKLAAASQQMQATAANIQNGQAKPAVAASVLQQMLPVVLPGGFVRTSVESASAGAGGLGGSNAKGEYTSGDQIVRLEVSDMGALGGLAAMGGALNVESSKETPNGYEKTGKVDGRLTTEKWDTPGKSGTYSTIVADRFMVEASGTAPSIDAFKQAVASIDVSQLETLAK